MSGRHAWGTGCHALIQEWQHKILSVNKYYKLPCWGASAVKQSLIWPHKLLASFQKKHLKYVVKVLLFIWSSKEWIVPTLMQVYRLHQSACFQKYSLCIHVLISIFRKIRNFVLCPKLIVLYSCLLQPFVVKRNQLRVTRISPVKMFCAWSDQKINYSAHSSLISGQGWGWLWL